MTDIDYLESAIQELLEESSLNELNEQETASLHERAQHLVSLKLAGLSAEEVFDPWRPF
jgi:hypothetical protein